MKNLKAGLVVFSVFLMLAGPVKAMEGTVSIGSRGGEMGSCLAVSVYLEGRYQILMTCRGLRSALDPVRNRYVAWVKKGENFKRLGEIVNGKMRANVDEDFSGIVITVEEDSHPRKPNEEVLLSGEMKEMVFEGVEMPKEEVVEIEVEEMDDRGAVVPTPMSGQTGNGGTSGNVLKTIGRALLTGFLVLLGVVGVLSFLSSRKKR